MTCHDYLEHHTALLDGDLSEERTTALSGHARGCPSCADYDRSVRRSLELLRDVDTIDVSDDFALRLQHRLLHVREEDAGTLRRRPPTMAAAVAVAGFLALAAWSPWLMERLAQPGTTAAVAGATGPALRTAGPPVLPPSPDATDLWHHLQPPAPFGASVAEGVQAEVYAIPGPSSPVVVTPPAMGGFVARPVSATVELYR